MLNEFKKKNEDVIRHPIEDSDLFVLIGKEYGEIRVSIRRMLKNKSTGMMMQRVMIVFLVCIFRNRKKLHNK